MNVCPFFRALRWLGQPIEFRPVPGEEGGDTGEHGQRAERRQKAVDTTLPVGKGGVSPASTRARR